MTNAKLKKLFTNIIQNNYGRELWHSRPEQPYEESLEPFIEDLMRVARCFKFGWKFKTIEYDAYEESMPCIPDHKIGQKIREFRLKKGLTLPQLAKKADMDIEYLFNVERGEPILRIWALEEILGVLGIKSSEVLHF